ncbi:MAG TPA: 4-hydroxy-tetrahydrodipicolinate synthase [Opitutaceae bacterium]|nr:4-hydroxy-tetrahydrodipicolinate synthase [Opitutaceae bacterium]
MKPRTLTGAITALATPFRGRDVSFADLKRLVDHQVRGGVDGIVPVGTTGESPTLSHEEHMDVVRATIEYARGRVPVIAGTGSNSTAEALELTRLSDEAGADAVLVVAPYYNKPSQEGLFRHYAAIAESTDLPIILYSIPSRCAVEIGVPLVERLRGKYSHVRWIKEAGGSVDRVDQLKRAMGDDIVVLSGDDALTLAFMASGAEGVISVASNVVPGHVTRMVRLMQGNDFAGALRLHRRLYPFFKALFIEPSPVPVKAALALARIIGSEEVRLPLCRMAPANRAILARALSLLLR